MRNYYSIELFGSKTTKRKRCHATIDNGGSGDVFSRMPPKQVVVFDPSKVRL